MKVLLLFITLSFLKTAFAKDPYHFAQIIEAKKHDSNQMGTELNIFIWNLYMFNYVDAQKIKSTRLKDKINEANFLLFQEIISDGDKTQSYLKLEEFNMFQIPYLKERKYDYLPDSINNGLATMSRFKAFEHRLIMGDAIDIADGTQSVAIVSTYSTAHKDLMIIHVHNGVSLFRTMNLLKKIKPIIIQHDGPLLVAGDFNSFFMKSKLVKKWAHQLELNDSDVKTPYKFKFINLGQLDHAFYRGMSLSSPVEVLKETQSLSDHKGYYLKFNLE